MSESHRAELADFLKAHRSRLRPSDVGLPGDLIPGRRRTPGLRREEVAELAGVSLTWYTWLEQGRKIAASPQVVDALARALRLNPVQHRQLRRLAGLADPVVKYQAGDEIARLQRLVDAMYPSPAVVHDARLDFVVWNSAFSRIRTDPTALAPERRNLLWWMYTDDRNRAMMRRWEAAARAIISQFRVLLGNSPGDPRLTRVVTELCAVSSEFRTWWSEYPVQDFQPTIIGIDHPEAGPINLELFQLRLVENPELLLVVQLPATDDDRERIDTYLNT
ncbi:helix-turn-helix transcriptional regulator [Nocardia goodfellowii]|uniref:Transcriptional regulator with XRE-family HTH domain n=1 Tax=Nocardia goodfellowii TaxID=882446 RepID=A0ABS4QDK1_9NOCA|nr:helix-turn-helix transcriptional regulator [Nocardia goodfellowii]MBP2189772.1 transcriptional regulator with XRE-family HTH domain [Nocardia goodfellowii]